MNNLPPRSVRASSPASASESAPLRKYALAAVLVFGLLAAIVLTASQENRPLATSVALMLSSGLAWACCWYRSEQSELPQASSWLILAVAALAVCLTQAWTLAVILNSLPVEWLEPVEPMLAIALAIFLVAVISFARPVRKPRLARLVLDGLVVAGSVMLLVAAMVLPELLQRNEHDVSLHPDVFLRPGVDILNVTICALLFARSPRGQRLPLALLAFCFLALSISDLAFAVQRLHVGLAMSAVNSLGWLLGFVLLAVAALVARPSVGEEQSSRNPSPLAASIVLFLLFLTATVTMLSQAVTGPIPWFAGFVWFVTSMAAFGRQMLFISDNERLRRSLEVKVLESTSDLEAISRQRELLLSSVGDGIYGVDQNLRIIFVNTAGIQLLGRAEQELIGADAHDLFHAPVAGQPFSKQDCYITEAISSGMTTAAEFDYYLNGSQVSFPVEVTASPVRGDDGITGAVVVFRDITERQEVDRMKSEFVSVVSHELRTPLTSIRGSLGLVAAQRFGPLPPEAGQMIDIAIRGTDRLTRLINDILDLERIEAADDTIDLVPVAVREVLDEALMSVTGLAADAGITITLGDAAGAILANRDQIVQALVNLLGNAIKFSEAGDVVRVEAHPKDRMVEFAVIDQGRGIPADKQPVIFDRFRQVDSSDAREKGGSGLGLAISERIVQRHGGKIWVSSSPGVGSTFRFTIPRAQSQLDSATKAQPLAN